MFTALYDFTGQDSTQLSFQRGEQVCSVEYSLSSSSFLHPPPLIIFNASDVVLQYYIQKPVFLHCHTYTLSIYLPPPPLSLLPLPLPLLLIAAFLYTPPLSMFLFHLLPSAKVRGKVRCAMVDNEISLNWSLWIRPPQLHRRSRGNCQ